MTTEENFWDRAGFKTETETYYKFDEPGDYIEGTISALDKHLFDGDEHPTPKLLIAADKAVTRGQDATVTEEDMEVTCGARNLKSLVMSERPGVGDHVRIDYTNKSGRTKIFEMKLTRGGAAAKAAAPAESPI